MARHHRQIGGNEGGAAGFLRFDEVARHPLLTAAANFPPLHGRLIRVRFRPQLTVAAGKLLSGKENGEAVHAASFLNQRLLILDSELLCYPNELRRILLHELFHFVWRRLGNQTRWQWETLLCREWDAKAKGELGWSAEWRKNAMQITDVHNRSRRWREYACESFCDTAAWLWGPPHAEHTLASRHRNHRKVWLQGIADKPFSI